MNTIILTAGKIDYTKLPFGMHQSNATIPVNGKPVISRILDDLITKNITDINIVIRKENSRLRELLDKYYSHRMKLRIIDADQPTSILDSLETGLKDIPDQQGTRIILGDTLIYDSYSSMNDFMYISSVRSSENWCIVKLDNNDEIITLIDKKKLEGDEHFALCGYYNFSDTALLKKTVEQQNKIGSKELSAVLMDYHSKKQIKVVKVENWYDFGHLESFIASRKSLMRPRHFNQLTIHPVLNTITKVSENNDKLRDELNWYLLLPDKLKVLTPRIIEEKYNDNKVSITQEFYGYPSLSELFVYGDLSISVWKSIIDYLFETHFLFTNYTEPGLPGACEDIYIKKTIQRVAQLKDQNNFWEKLWNQEYIRINDKKFLNYPELLIKLKDSIDNLCHIEKFSIIHGDYCLSNILYDLNNQIVRLIDPRGSFGVSGIYGDPRYDIAKLRHSISGCYDYIISDLFSLSMPGENNFTISIFNDEKNKELAAYTDQIIKNTSYDLDAIKLIEGLLFLSMLPFHIDFFERQQMMYLQGLIILNELCE